MLEVAITLAQVTQSKQQHLLSRNYRLSYAKDTLFALASSRLNSKSPGLLRYASFQGVFWVSFPNLGQIARPISMVTTDA